MTTNMSLSHFIRREDGALTAFGIFLIVAMICVGGLGIDVANAIKVRTHLQVAADSAAHAAIVSRELGIPAVVGTRDATQRIPDGARVRVDGAAGRVEVL